MNQFNFENKQATPEWLTSVLSRNGFLSKGKVSSIEQETTLSDMTLLSTFYALKLKYSNGSSGNLPSKILLKVIKPEFYNMGQNEFDFYNAVANLKDPLPLPTCYGLEKFHETKQVCILPEFCT